MNKNTLISVVIPVYNPEAQKLIRLVDSIVTQNFKNIEVLLIDDGSTNEIAAVCEKLAKNDFRIKVYHNPNRGISFSRNFGLKLCEGEYVLFADHDDEYISNSFNYIYKFCLDNDLDVLKFGYEYVCLDGNPRFPFKELSQKEYIYSQYKDMMYFYPKLKDAGILTFVWDSLFKKSFLIENKISFDTQFKIGQEDIDFCNKFFIKKPKIGIIKDKVYRHYRYKNSTSRGGCVVRIKKLVNDELVVLNKELLYWKEYGNSVVAGEIISRNVNIILASIARRDVTISNKDKIEMMDYVRKFIESSSECSCYVYSNVSLKKSICSRLLMRKKYKSLLAMIDCYYRVRRLFC